MEEIFAICTHQSCEADVLVIDANVKALADELLDEVDQRTLSEIIGTSFEAHAEKASRLLSLRQYHRQTTDRLPLVRRKDGIEDGEIEIEAARLVSQRP